MSFIEKVIEDFGSIESGIAWFEKNLNKEPVDYRLNLQVLTNLIGQEERAFEISNQLIMIAPEDPRVLFNRGWHLMKRGKFKEGFSLVENGRRLGAFGSPQPASPMPILEQNMKIPEHAHILLALEGGFGDEMINVRFVRNILRKFGRKTIVACQPTLIPLFAKLPEVSAAIAHAAVPGVYHDFWIPGMSAPRLLCDSKDDILGNEPYLQTKNLLNLPAWKELIFKNHPDRQKMKVGIRWSGSSQFEHQQFRRFPPSIILDLQKMSDIQLFSFQRDEDMIDLPDTIVDLAPFLRDWTDTACAMSEMDLVISSCTSTAHCAAALGVKTWVITPVLPYYIWAENGNRSSWYKDVTLFRQTAFGQWDDVGDSLKTALKDEINRFSKQNLRAS